MFFCFVGVRQYFTLYRPADAQPTIGRVVAVQLNYNKTVYVTRVEERLLSLTGEVPMLLLVVFGLAIGGREIWKRNHAP